MTKWTVDQARAWAAKLPWLIGCNFLPSSAINQLEMWQDDTFDPDTIDRELGWAKSLGFNALRVYLHDLVWRDDAEGLCQRMEAFLTRTERHGMRVLFVLFDDCHRPDPQSGPQPLPVSGVHNSGWKHSPGAALVRAFDEGSVAEEERIRLESYVEGILARFADDQRILMWDLYNEPGQSWMGDTSHALLKQVWKWAQEARPSQPLTACTDGSVGELNIALNREQSDVMTFHRYQAEHFEATLKRVQSAAAGRPILCTEYMARELGTTFQFSLPILRELTIGCFNWGLVAGRSQTHFNWDTVRTLADRRTMGMLLQPDDPIPEPDLWFHDIFRRDGSPFDPAEVDFIKHVTGKTQ